MLANEGKENSSESITGILHPKTPTPRKRRQPMSTTKTVNTPQSFVKESATPHRTKRTRLDVSLGMQTRSAARKAKNSGLMNETRLFDKVSELFGDVIGNNLDIVSGESYETLLEAFLLLTFC